MDRLRINFLEFMRPIGLGTDILKIDRIKQLCSRQNMNRFARRILSSNDFVNYFSETPSERAILYLSTKYRIIEFSESLTKKSTSFSAKESIYKALFPLYDCRWKEISIKKGIA